MDQLTRRAALVVRGLRKHSGSNPFPDLRHDLTHAGPEFGSELHRLTASRARVPNVPVPDRDTQHFFETHGLRTELQICRVSMADSRFVFDGSYLSILHLDDIGSARKSQRLRPERNPAEHLFPPLAPVLSAIYSSVRPHTPHRVFVVRPDAVHVDERALSWAIREVLDGGDGNGEEFRSQPFRAEACRVLRVTCLVRKCLPAAVDAQRSPTALSLWVPDIQQRVHTPEVERLMPRRPTKRTLPAFTPGAEPSPLDRVRAAGAIPLIGAQPSDGEQGKTEERKDFDHGIREFRGRVGKGSEASVVEPETVLVDARCATGKGRFDQIGDGFRRSAKARYGASSVGGEAT